MIKLLIHNPVKAILLWAAFIFVLCATPGRYIPSASWLELLSFDKFVHASIFFILCGLTISFVVSKNGSNLHMATAFFISALYGVSLEWMQANWFSERSADILDILANTFGCAVALFFNAKIKRLHAAHDR